MASHHLSPISRRHALLLLGAASSATLLPLPVFAHGTPGRPKLPTLTDKDEEKLREGKLFLTTERDAAADGAGTITGLIEIDGAPEDVWKVLLDFESIPQSSKAVKEANRYADDRGSPHRIINMQYMVKVAWVEITYHIHHDYFADQGYLVWTLDEAKDNGIELTIGSFSTWPGSAPGKTRFLYRTRVSTGRSIPDWVEEDLSEGSLKSYIRYVKKQVEA